jgi:RHS repeat-associated protein
LNFSNSFLQFDYGTTNNNGNVLEQRINVPSLAPPLVQTYQYDQLNRLALARETYNNGAQQSWQQSFSYDRFGNRSFVAGTTVPSVLTNQTNPTVNPATNRLSSDGSYSYDYDAAGNLTSAPGHTFVYDAANRIVLSNYAAPNQQPNPNTYVYDGDGQRVMKVTANGQEKIVFVYNAMGQMVAEYNNSMPASENQTSYLTSDMLGTPRVITKQDGVVKAQHDYLPFGEELFAGTGGRTGSGQQEYPSDDAGQGIRQKFTRKERDAETGLDYFVARYYSSTQGRFTSPDPLLSSGAISNPQTWNRYAYTINNPLKYTDPFGMYICTGSKAQCQDVEKGLKNLEKARDSFKKGSKEYNQLDRSRMAYGAKGVDNGVEIRFGATKNGGPAATEIGTRDRDQNGVKDITVDNPTGQDTIVMIDPTQNKSADDYVLSLGHEGSHVADGSDLVGALPKNLSSPSVAAVLGGSSNLTQYVTETRAYEASSAIAQGRGAGSLSVGPPKGNKYEIWNSGWSQADRATKRAAGIDKVLAEPKSKGGLYEVTPTNQGAKLIP